MKEKIEPIKSQEEFDAVYEYLIFTAVNTLKISRRAAEMRINALRKSGLLLNLGPPDGQPFQIGVDVAMRLPQLGNENE